jgi:hypothetical protein
VSKKDAPERLTFAEALMPVSVSAFNVSLEINRPDPDIPSKEANYNSTTDNGLASRRSKHVMRSHAEIEAARSGDLPLGDGLSLRQPMAGQGENDQFPGSTNQYGKQRS